LCETSVTGYTVMSLSTKEYFIRETYKSIRRNGFMSFASVSTVTVSLLVLGLFLLIFLNTNNLTKYLESQVQVTVYMQDSATAKDLETMGANLKKLDGVVSVKQVSKAEALQRFKERLGEQQNLLSALGTDNPFPNSFEVQVDVPSRIKDITPAIHEMPKVETARFGQEVVEHLFSLTRILRFGGIVLVLFLSLATLFIISNTIRLTVFARRKEVTIMKYVGATDWFIRWPFLMEGMTLGFWGAVFSGFFITIIYSMLLGRIYATLAFFPLLPTWPTMLYVDIFILLVGTGIGALGSYISLRKFLRV
jgi:cell division transport system permease protein